MTNPYEQVGVTHFWGDHQYAKRIELQAGQMVGKHMHTYTHLSIVAKGRVLVRTDGGDGSRKLKTQQEYKAGDCVKITANTLHHITALEDSIWFCTHATDETDPDKVDQVTIMKGRT